MNLAGEHVLLRIYLQTADRAPHSPTYERIVRQARSDGLAGATVLRGLLGLGSHGMIRRSVWSIVEHVPVIVEIVDTAEKIKSFVDRSLAALVPHGLATLERAGVMLYRHRADPAGEPMDLARQAWAATSGAARHSAENPSKGAHENQRAGRAIADLHRRIRPLRRSSPLFCDRRASRGLAARRGDRAAR